jgi:hypothetical protein
MAIISVILTESPVQVVAGIPRTITFDTNIPATVFYTLDGSQPSLLYSEVALGPISMPTHQGTVVVRVFASDGFNTSAVFSYTFGPNFTVNRNSRDEVIFLENPNFFNRAFGAGDSGSSPAVLYKNTGGIDVNSLGDSGVIDGYNSGEVVSYTDKPYTFDNYEIKYSQTDFEGRTGPGIGNLPSKVTMIVPPQYNKSFNANSKLFNPHAMVIYQDGTKEPADPDYPLTNRMDFSLPLRKNIRDGSRYYTTGFEGNPVTGGMVRPIYNAKDNTYTFYYRDSESNRWIISKEAMPAPKPAPDYVLPQTSFAEKKVYRWIVFKRQWQPG